MIGNSIDQLHNSILIRLVSVVEGKTRTIVGITCIQIRVIVHPISFCNMRNSFQAFLNEASVVGLLIYYVGL